MDGDGGTLEAKQRAGESAAAVVDDGMVVGLGTGSTAAQAIKSLGHRIADGLDIVGIPTSYDSRQRAIAAGIPLTSLDVSEPDVVIDGADQVAPTGLIKGGGAAHTREKIVAFAADKMIVVIDDSKLTPILDQPVPIEVIPRAASVVLTEVANLHGSGSIRSATEKDGPLISDNGNLIIDAQFGSIDTPVELADTLADIPGIVEHGLFIDMADEFHIGTDLGVSIREQPLSE